MPFKIQIAESLIKRTALAPAHPAGPAMAAAPVPPTDFDTARDQALVVGSDVLSFTTGVEADFRRTISDSALFAELATNQQMPVTQEPMGWFDSYFGILSNLGWVVQSRETAEYKYKGDGFDVHQAIVQVITDLLPGASAVKAVLAVLNGLHQMDANAPFITIFNRESRHGEIGRFQFTYVYNDKDHGLMAEVMAFALQADSQITQVLFFKLHKDRTSLRRSVGTFSISASAMAQLAPALETKLAAYRAAYIAGVTLAPPSPAVGGN